MIIPLSSRLSPHYMLVLLELLNNIESLARCAHHLRASPRSLLELLHFISSWKVPLLGFHLKQPVWLWGSWALPLVQSQGRCDGLSCGQPMTCLGSFFLLWPKIVPHNSWFLSCKLSSYHVQINEVLEFKVYRVGICEMSSLHFLQSKYYSEFKCSSFWWSNST